MINKLKIIFLSFVVLAFIGFANSAKADLTYSSDTAITVNAINLTIKAGSVASSVVVGGVNNSTLSVTVPASSTFTLASNDRFMLGNSAGLAQSCTSSQNSVMVSGPASVIFSPVATLCSTIGVSDMISPSGSVSINGGTSATSSLSVSLSLSASDNVGVTQMMISNDSGFAGASWETFMTTKSWTLASGDGSKTVYVKFRDAAGNVSASVSSMINVSGSGTVAVVVNPPAPVQGCSGSNLYNTSTGALCVNNSFTSPGCSGGNLFDVFTGQACMNNAARVAIAGCVGTMGFSTVTGQSCTNNLVTINGTSIAANSFDFGTINLMLGSKGEAVKQLQLFLNAKLGITLVVDGELGPKTTAIVKKWQGDHGLVADGMIGPKTKASMNAEAAMH